MLAPRPPVPLLGAVARTSRGRERLSAEGLHDWSRPWLEEPDPAAWWVDRDAGVALLWPERVTGAAPEADGGDPRGALAIRGALTWFEGRRRPPAGWTVSEAEDDATALFYDLLERGSTAVAGLRGQFALALWDGRRRRLLLARDHLGQRNVYLHTGPDLLVFCSELAPLLRAPGHPCELDPEAAVWYLAFGMPPPGRTLARGRDRLPAAHALSWQPGDPPSIRRYWTPLSAEAHRRATPEVVEEIREELDRALERTLAAGQPWGLQLSGGVDSTYLASRALAFGAPPATTLTAAFEERHGINETDWGRWAAGRLGLRHEVVSLGSEEALELLEDVVLAVAEPCAAWATLTQFVILARMQQLGMTRLLSGLGADEIFGGYDDYRGYYARFLRHTRRQPPPPGMEPFDALLQSERQSSRRVLFPGMARFFRDPALRKALHAPYRDWHQASHLRSFYRECRRLKPEAQVMEMMIAHECQHRIPDLLYANFEPLARQMGIRVGYPFLDPDVVRRVIGLEAESRYRTPTGRFSLRLRALHPRFKHAMLQVATGRVPREILERKRDSYTAPFGGWMCEPGFFAPVVQRLGRSRFWDQGIVRREWLGEVLARISPWPTSWIHQLWALVTLSGWFDRFADPP